MNQKLESTRQMRVQYGKDYIQGVYFRLKPEAIG